PQQYSFAKTVEPRHAELAPPVWRQHTVLRQGVETFDGRARFAQFSIASDQEGLELGCTISARDACLRQLHPLDTVESCGGQGFRHISGSDSGSQSGTPSFGRLAVAG